SATGNVLANDSNTDPDAELTASLVTDPATLPGTLVFNADGTYTFTPDAGFAGPLEVVYTVCDDATPASCATATLHILVEPAPVANPDFNVAYIDKPIKGDVSTNDVVAAGTTYGTPKAGTDNRPGATLTMNPDGTYTFEAVAAGVYTYLVPVCGPDGKCVDVLLTITVQNPAISDQAPIVNTDLGVTKEGDPVRVNTLGNDSAGRPGVALNPASVNVTEQPKNGTVTVDPVTGDMIYTPNPGFVGVDSYSYTVCDTGDPALCSTAVQQITVVAKDTPNKVAAADDFVRSPSAEKATGNVLDNDADLTGDGFTVTPQQVKSEEGVFTMNSDGTYEFVPAPGFIGPISFVYTVCDNGTPQACATATLYILITPNDLEANMDNFQDNEVNGLTGGTAGNVLDNDKLNGNPVKGSEVTISIKDDGGMAGVSIDKDGNLIVPKGTAPGTYVITYTICDVLDPRNCDEAIAIVEVFHGVNLKITKLAEAEEWFEGDEFGFTMIVENNGQTDATAVEVIDLLPEGLRYVTSTVEGATAETQVNGQQITWTVASLPSGSSLQIKIQVKAAPLEGGRARTLVNTATVSSPQRELSPDDNSSSAAVNIKAFFIPNTITPNGDRINDTFEIPGLGRYVSNELLIFNRWGDHVYERKNYQNDWSAEGLVSGTYFYLLKVTDESGKDQEFKGFIQVVKERIR
ncbi:Ig-like domain-containing protein, partial [Belliella aquatica]